VIGPLGSTIDALPTPVAVVGNQNTNGEEEEKEGDKD
jgi:hypothetical protein